MFYHQVLPNHHLPHAIRHFLGQRGNPPMIMLAEPMRIGIIHLLRYFSTPGRPTKQKQRSGSDSKKKECPPGVKPQSFELDVKPASCITPDLADKISDSWEQPRVVIIGAGIAGLSAAEHLKRYGFDNITIVEAKDRPGGRIFTCNMDKTVIELGADKIYGGSIVNPLVPTIASDSVSAQSLRRHKSPASMLFLSETGSVLRTNIVSKVQKMFEEMLDRAKNIYRKSSREEYSSLKEYFDSFLDREIPANFKMQERSDAIKVVNTLITDLENQWGTELSNISANYYGSRVDIPGYILTFEKGLSNVLKQILKNMSNCCLSLKKPVKYIKWDLPNNLPRAVIVTCENEEIAADYVIVTVSLGVLKTQAQNIFCPPLPEEKLLSIESIGFGHINKVFLQYNKPFWVNQEPHIKPAISCIESDWLDSIGVIEEVPVPNSTTLVATFGGNGAKEIECENEFEIVKRIQRLLRCATGDMTLPYPKSVLRTRWSSDGHICGALTYMSVDSNIGDIMQLSDPVPLSSPNGAPVIFFAGEATSPCHYGTVHGARQSGIREADRIIHLTKLFCGLPPRMESHACAN